MDPEIIPTPTPMSKYSDLDKNRSYVRVKISSSSSFQDLFTFLATYGKVISFLSRPSSPSDEAVSAELEVDITFEGKDTAKAFFDILNHKLRYQKNIIIRGALYLKYGTSSTLENKVVLVTGGGGAIGRNICLVLVSHGARVWFCDINKEACEETVKQMREIARSPTSCDYSIVDTSNETQVSTWINNVASTWGTVDVLVNNAIVFVLKSVEEATSEDWDRALNVNVKGYALPTKYVAPVMRKQKKGSIINIGSISAFVAQPCFVPYNTTKGAVLQLTRCTAMDLGPDGIRVNIVCPGTIETPATHLHASRLNQTFDELATNICKDHMLKRLGNVEDVSQAVLFLASDDSTFVTASSIMIDGGYIAH